MSQNHPHKRPIGHDANFITVQLPPIDYRKCHSKSDSIASAIPISDTIGYSKQAQNSWEILGDDPSECQPNPSGPLQDDGQEISIGDEILLTPELQEYVEGHKTWSLCSVTCDLGRCEKEVSSFLEEGSLEAGVRQHYNTYLEGDIPNDLKALASTRESELGDQLGKSDMNWAGHRHTVEGGRRGNIGKGSEKANGECEGKKVIFGGQVKKIDRVELGHTKMEGGSGDMEEVIGDAGQKRETDPQIAFLTAQVASMLHQFKVDSEGKWKRNDSDHLNTQKTLMVYRLRSLMKDLPILIVSLATFLAKRAKKLTHAQGDGNDLGGKKLEKEYEEASDRVTSSSEMHSKNTVGPISPTTPKNHTVGKQGGKIPRRKGKRRRTVHPSFFTNIAIINETFIEPSSRAPSLEAFILRQSAKDNLRPQHDIPDRIQQLGAESITRFRDAAIKAHKIRAKIAHPENDPIDLLGRLLEVYVAHLSLHEIEAANYAHPPDRSYIDLMMSAMSREEATAAMQLLRAAPSDLANANGALVVDAYPYVSEQHAKIFSQWYDFECVLTAEHFHDFGKL